jgi:DNA-binding NarL/FixJ family response regulator
MRRPALALLAAGGVVFGVAAEWVSYDGGGVAKAAADLAVGCILVAGGAVAWGRRPESRVGGIMSLAGVTWFLGTLVGPAVFLHRGPLVHLHLSYPTGRTPTRLARAVVVAAYVDAAVDPLARSDVLTLGLSAAVALTAVRLFHGTSGPARKAGGPALGAALAFAGVLALGALERLTGWWSTDGVLFTYDLVIASVAIVLVVDLLRGRWADAVVTGLVVDLGAAGEASMLGGRLARALGDPTLVVGYRLPDTGALVDDAGRAVDLPIPGSGRTATPIEVGDERIAVLVHDEALLADRRLLESVAAAARFAVSNARLQAEVRERAADLEASRRRIVEAGDAQRRRLEQELRLGAERRLDRVASLLAGSGGDGAQLRALESELAEARRELREFAQGIHPAALTEHGLTAALELLREHAAVPVELRAAVGRLPEPIEEALFFVCSGARTGGAAVRVVIADDETLLREGLTRLLVEEGFDVVATSSSADELVRRVALTRPDVAIVDIRMPPTHTDEGLVAASEIRDAHPEVGVLVLSHYLESSYAMRLLQDHPERSGYLLKERVSDIAVLVDALQRIADGECVLDPTIVARLVGRAREPSALDELTGREREVLALMAEGHSNDGICRRLFLSPKTVETHVRHILLKLDIGETADYHRRVLAVLAYLRG